MSHMSTLMTAQSAKMIQTAQLHLEVDMDLYKDPWDPYTDRLQVEGPAALRSSWGARQKHKENIDGN